MSIVTQTPPEVNYRSDRDEVLRLINWLRRNVGVFVGDAQFWVSTSSSSLTSEVDIGALPAPGGLLYVTIAAGVATPSIAIPNTHFPSVDAYYVVTRATNAPPNAFDLGGLVTGVLQQTVTLGVAVPEAVPLVESDIVFGGSDSLIAQDHRFVYDTATGSLWLRQFDAGPQTATIATAFSSNETSLLIRSDATAGALNLETGTAFSSQGPAIQLRANFYPTFHDWVSFQRTRAVSFSYTSSGGIDSNNGVFKVDLQSNYEFNGNTSSLAGSAVLDSFSWRGVTHRIGGSNSTNADGVNFHAFYPGTLLSAPNWSAESSATVAIYGPTVFTPVDGSVGTIGAVYGLRITGADSTTSARLDGCLIVNGQASTAVQVSDFAGGGDKLVYATDADGCLALVNLGSGLSFSGGTLTATGSGGTVTSVTATPPMYSSGGATPNITIGYDAVTLIMDGFGNLVRSALTGVIDVPAASNTATFTAFAALSVLANATAGVAVPTHLAASTNGDVLRMAGGVLGWGTIPASSVTGLAPTNATYITQTPDGTLTNEQALSLLGTGVMSSTTATGVVATTTFTAGSIPFGASSILSQDNANLFWNAGTVKMGIGTNSLTTPTTGFGGAAQVGKLFIRDTTASSYTSIVIAGGTSTSGGAAIQYTDTSNTPTCDFGMTQGATNTGTLYFVNRRSSGDIQFLTSSGGLAARITVQPAGEVDLSTLSAGGMVKAAVTTGRLSIATPGTDFQAAITWPAVDQILYSSGTTTAPVGVAGLKVDTATQQLRVIGTSASQAWFNLLSGGDYERYIAYWTGNTWTIDAQAGGSGTIRPMTIDTKTAALTLSATGAGGTVNLMTAGAGANPQVSVTDSTIDLQGNITKASTGGMTLDLITMRSNFISISGTTHITTATGVNLINVQAPVYGGSSSKTVDLAATMYFAGPPAASGGTTIVNAYTVWIDDGEFRLDGAVGTSGGSTAALGNTPGDPNQAGWLNIVSNGTEYMLPLFYRT